MHLSQPSLYSFAVFLTVIVAELQEKPKISSKGADLHLSSGNGGNIVFEQSQNGKIYFGTHELNLSNTAGPPGRPGKPGIKGDRGDKGDKGADSSGGVLEPKGDKGDRGQTGPPGRNGEKGERGEQGWPGREGSPGQTGPKGTSGAPGNPGRPGPAVNVGPTIYYTDLDKKSENCNRSMIGVLRYSIKGLQICTEVGWRNIALDVNPPHCRTKNIPERNLQAFYNGNPGIMFQFNKDIKPMLNPSNYTPNITSEIIPPNSNPQYVEAVMRQAFYFTGNDYINVTGIPATFWQDSNWTITALVKLGDQENSSGSNDNDIPLLGIGRKDGSGQDVLRLGFRGTKRFEVVFELNNGSYGYGNLTANSWYHITWTSQKNYDGSESRCVRAADVHGCDGKQRKRYFGNGAFTIGAWPNSNITKNLMLDHLIISSGIIDYSSTPEQLCFAKLVDKRLP